MKKRVCMIATGGTIASVRGEAGLRPRLSGEAVLARAGMRSKADVSVVELMAVDSTDIVPSHWQEMARAISARREAFDGFIVTHGTDTMAYTAAALFLMLENIDRPVVLTGAQLPIEAPGSDAAANLCAALAAAASGRAGVMVAFGGLLLAGDAVRKIYSESFAAFRPVNRMPLGAWRGGALHWNVCEDVPAAPFCLRDRLDARAAVLKLAPGMEPASLLALVDTGIRAVIIEGFGAGGVPKAFLPALEEARSRGVRLLGTTQCTYDGACLSRYENGVLAMRAGLEPGGARTTEFLLVEAMRALGEAVGGA